jgi:TnpA family transposase
MRRHQLTEAQITALLDPPTDQRELVRHYTLSAADLAAIRRCRGDHNRLGHAVMLFFLRYPGRPLKAGERPPRPFLLFIAGQIDALPESIEDYLAAERNRQRHVLGLRPFGTHPAADLAGWLLPHAIENDRLLQR